MSESKNVVEVDGWYFHDDKPFFNSTHFSPRDSGVHITSSAEDFSINDEAVQKVANIVYDARVSGKLAIANFKQQELHPKTADEKAIDWIFLVDTLNFSFWTGLQDNIGIERTMPKWEVMYNGKNHTGYFGLCAAVNRAMDEGMDLTNPQVYGDMTCEKMENICRSETTTKIPMVRERVESLHEVSRVLTEKFNGSFVNCIKEAKKSAQALLEIIAKNFKCYRDECRYICNRDPPQVTVTFYKRAQILIADIWACFEGQGLGEFKDIDSLTMFADYRIPQVLDYLGVLQYSPRLKGLLEKGRPLKFGDKAEAEIRGGSICAVDKIVAAVNQMLIDNNSPKAKVNAILVDHFLWDYRREHAEEVDCRPFHKTRSIFY